MDRFKAYSHHRQDLSSTGFKGKGTIMKKAFILFCTNILAFLKWILSVLRDISTAIREGDKASPISHRRCIAVTFVVAFIYSIAIAIRTFTDLLQYGWIAALIFIPSVICVVAAIIFSYFASIKDFKETISAVGGVITGEGIDFDCVSGALKPIPDNATA
jgi:uncharacterized membrane protein YhaH (DUF805 family)